MAISTPVYCTREQVKNALDIRATALVDDQIDRALESAARSIEGDLGVIFYPLTATKYFDWPSSRQSASWRLWLDGNDLISLTTLIVGGDTIAASSYNLEPNDSGPPYDRIELKRNVLGGFYNDSTSQRAIAATGVWGHSASSAAAGALSEALDASEVQVDVSNSAIVGVGTIIQVNDERMLVTEKDMLTSSQTLSTSLTASNADVTVAVTTGSAYFKGEVIQIDSEQMLITSIAGNNLTVKRAYNGTVLAAHSNVANTIYVPRTLTVVRGFIGTTAATHDSGAAITKHVVPGLATDLAVAEVINQFEQELSAYARTIGAGENVRNASGAGIADLRKRAYNAYGHKARIMAV